MLKKCLLTGMAVILLVSIGGLASCKGYPKTPEDVVKELYLCTSKMDYEGCKRLFSKASYFPTEREFRELLEIEFEGRFESYEYYEVENVEIEGDRATVIGTIHFTEGTEPDAIVLIKEDGSWKVYE